MSKVIDNIEDIATIDSKAVLTTTQTALDLKANIASPTFTGTVTAPTFIGALNGNATTATSANDATKMPLEGGGFTGLVATAGNSQTFNSANDTTLSVRSNGTGTPATMSFHRPGAYAINFGLDTDNVLKAGGWSAGSSYPVMLDTAHTFATNGYQRFSNGLIIQWGTAGSISTGGTVATTFPISFPSFCASVSHTRVGTTMSYDGIECTAKSTSSFSLRNANTATYVYWVAIGY